MATGAVGKEGEAEEAGAAGPDGGKALPRHLSGLHLVGDFLRALATADADGRVLWSPARRGQEPTAQFVLLNPALHFREVVDQARSVLMLGGTMAPVSAPAPAQRPRTGLTQVPLSSPPSAQMDDLVRQLFGHLPPSRVRTLTVDHVVPPSHVLPRAFLARPRRTRTSVTPQAFRTPAALLSRCQRGPERDASPVHLQAPRRRAAVAPAGPPPALSDPRRARWRGHLLPLL